jgi:hypothetical protein
MHLVNCSVAPAQLLPNVLLLVCAACACVGSGAALDEPPKRPLMLLPTTWPIEEPMATPLSFRFC